MRWGLIGGAVAAAGVAAYVGTQVMQSGSTPNAGSAAVAPAPQGKPAPAKEALAAGLTEALGAPGQAMASAIQGASGVSSFLQDLSPGGERASSATTELPAEGDQSAGTRTVTAKTRVEGSGSQRTAHIDFTINERRGANGFNLRGRLIASVDICPDVDGAVAFQFDLQASGDNHFANVAGTGGFSVNMNARGGGTASVNDSAVLTGYRKRMEGGYTFRGGENLSDGSVGGKRSATMRAATDGSFNVGTSNAVTTQAEAAGRLSLGAGDSRTTGATYGGSGPTKVTVAMTAEMDSIVDGALRSLLQSAQNAWRGGQCVEVVVSPPLRDNGEKNRTQPAETKDIEVKVRHRFEGGELPLPLDATLVGKDKLGDPKHVERAPGHFVFTAGPDEKDWGRVELKTVSRRGIGESQVAFENGGEWAGEFKVSSAGGGAMDMTMSGSVRWRPREGAKDEYIVESGTYTLTASRRNCASQSRGTLGAGDGELEVKRDGNGAVVAYRGVGMKPITFKIACVGVHSTQTLPAPWFATGEEFRPATSGSTLAGTLSDPEGHWRWEWKFERQGTSE